MESVTLLIEYHSDNRKRNRLRISMNFLFEVFTDILQTGEVCCRLALIMNKIVVSQSRMIYSRLGRAVAKLQSSAFLMNPFQVSS